jgi:EipB-like
MRYFVALLLVALPPGTAMAAKIAPHRAIYDLQLDRGGTSSSLASVDGRLAFEVAEAGCDGWTVTFRMANRYTPFEGDVRLVDTQSTSYESADGLKLDYSEKTFLNQKLESETRLKVGRQGAAQVGQGEITKPKQLRFEVSPDALFPLQHQVHIMELAAQGGTRDTSLVFDGSDEDKATRAISFIGKENAAGQGDPDEQPGLATLRSWPVTMSYFELSGNNQDTPAYSISFDLFENGIASGLKMDYGTFKLKGSLSHLEYLETETCN